jgi:hypothetical protein
MAQFLECVTAAALTGPRELARLLEHIADFALA